MFVAQHGKAADKGHGPPRGPALGNPAKPALAHLALSLPLDYPLHPRLDGLVDNRHINRGQHLAELFPPLFAKTVLPDTRRLPQMAVFEPLPYFNLLLG